MGRSTVEGSWVILKRVLRSIGRRDQGVEVEIVVIKTIYTIERVIMRMNWLEIWIRIRTTSIESITKSTVESVIKTSIINSISNVRYPDQIRRRRRRRKRKRRVRKRRRKCQYLVRSSCRSVHLKTERVIRYLNTTIGVDLGVGVSRSRLSRIWSESRKRWSWSWRMRSIGDQIVMIRLGKSSK